MGIITLTVLFLDPVTITSSKQSTLCTSPVWPWKRPSHSAVCRLHVQIELSTLQVTKWSPVITNFLTSPWWPLKALMGSYEDCLLLRLLFWYMITSAACATNTCLDLSSWIHGIRLKRQTCTELIKLVAADVKKGYHFFIEEWWYTHSYKNKLALFCQNGVSTDRYYFTTNLSLVLHCASPTHITYCCIATSKVAVIFTLHLKRGSQGPLCSPDGLNSDYANFSQLKWCWFWNSLQHLCTQWSLKQNLSLCCLCLPPVFYWYFSLILTTQKI